MTSLDRVRRRYHVPLPYMPLIAYSLGALYLALLAINQWRPIVYAPYLNYLVVLAIAIGAVAFIVEPEQEPDPESSMGLGWLAVLAVAAVIAAMVIMRFPGLGWISYVVALAAAATTISLGTLVLDGHSPARTTTYFSPYVVISVLLAIIVAAASIVAYAWGVSAALRIVLGGSFLLVIYGTLLASLLPQLQGWDALECILLGVGCGVAIVPIAAFLLRMLGLSVPISIALALLALAVLVVFMYLRSAHTTRRTFSGGERDR